MKLVSYLKPLKKINLERIKNSIIRHKIKTFRRKYQEKKLLDTGLRNEFWENIPKTQAARQKSPRDTLSN